MKSKQRAELIGRCTYNELMRMFYELHKPINEDNLKIAARTVLSKMNDKDSTLYYLLYVLEDRYIIHEHDMICDFLTGGKYGRIRPI